MNKVLKQCLGVDVSKLSLSLSLGCLNSDLSKEFKSHHDLSNDIEGYRVLVEWLAGNIDKRVNFIIVMEATGVYHQQVSHYLYGQGFDVCIMPSGRVKRYAQSLVQRSKTDALDSKILSMPGLERTMRLWHPPSLSLEQLKVLSKERSTLLKDRTVETNRQGAITSSMANNARASRRHKARLKLLNLQIASIEQEMRCLVSKDQALEKKLGYLDSILGISFISAATVVGETLGFESITSGKQLAGYAGYDVVLR